MADHALRQLDSRRHQKRRPVDGVEADDVLADEMHVRRPPAPEGFVVAAPEAERRDVVRQRIEPDVDDVIGIAGPRDAPGDRRSGDGEIFQTLLHEGAHFVEAALRENELGMGAIVREKPLTIAR